jgi:hypothetical protein
MRIRSVISAPLFCAGFIAVGAWAQAPADSSPSQDPPAVPAGTQTPPPAAPPAKSIFSLGKVDFSGSADVYYSWNDNHPTSGFNQLTSFNDKTDQFNLNMAKLTANMDPAPIGFRVDIGLGRTFDNIYPQAPNPSFFRYVEQAYISVKPKGMKGFEADFGQFVTSAGAEVIETKDNWNYSRSLLFTWAVPLTHFGLRTSMPIGSSVTVGVQVVNGWNDIIDPNGHNMQTVGIVANLTRKKYTWSNNYYSSPNPTYSGPNLTVNNARRNLYDTTLLLTPNDKLSAYINFDYGGEARLGGGSDHYSGIAGAVRYQINKYFAISPRFESFWDSNGFTTGTVQHLHEITLTGEYKIHDGILARAEFRHDGSDVPFFQRGADPAKTHAQSTVTIGLIAYFAAKH